MEKPVLTLKPHIVGAAIPILVRNSIYTIMVSFSLYGIFAVLRRVSVIDFTNSTIVINLVIIGSILTFAPLVVKIVLLYNTTYYFFNTHVVKEFELLKVKRQSVPYRQIANITTDISFWNRIIGSGDITLHTADDNAPNLVLDHIEQPDKIEEALYRVMKKHQ